MIFDGRMFDHLSRFFSETCLIETPTYTKNDYGEKIPSWSTLYSDVSCVFGQPLGRRTLSEQRTEAVVLNANMKALILAGDYSDVTTSERATVNGTVYDIRDVRTDPTDSMTELIVEKVSVA